MAINACKTSNAHEFIMELPQDYDTHVGNRGTSLSGGQKQRLAIARAIIKDPPILILDEATSALDTRSEAIVQHALDAAGNNRTTISISHRLATTKSSDQIVVMRNGSIAELGTHQSLLSDKDGTYRRLWNAQEITPAHNPNHEEEENHNNLLLGANTTSTTRMQDVIIESISDQEASDNQVIGLPKVIWAILSDQKRYWWAYFLLVGASIIGGWLKTFHNLIMRLT
jgi:ATP-binding cassette subfamily B (MDR/TAP) protein 1